MEKFPEIPAEILAKTESVRNIGLEPEFPVRSLNFRCGARISGPEPDFTVLSRNFRSGARFSGPEPDFSVRSQIFSSLARFSGHVQKIWSASGKSGALALPYHKVSNEHQNKHYRDGHNTMVIILITIRDNDEHQIII